MNILGVYEDCYCPEEYSIERHGNGYALYLGRCNHRHGLNLANITEPDLKRLKEMVTNLNELRNPESS